MSLGPRAQGVRFSAQTSGLAPLTVGALFREDPTVRHPTWAKPLSMVIMVALPLIITTGQARLFQMKHPCAEAVLAAGLDSAVTEWNELGLDWPETFHITDVWTHGPNDWEIRHEDSWRYRFTVQCLPPPE